MLRRASKYITEKVTKSVVGKIVRWGFWSVVLLCPTAIVGTVGIPALAVAAITVHSGVIEYGTSKIITNKIDC